MQLLCCFQSFTDKNCLRLVCYAAVSLLLVPVGAIQRVNLFL